MLFRAIFLVLLASLLGCQRQEGTAEENQKLILEVGQKKIFLNEFLFYKKLNYPELTEEETDHDLLSYIYDKFERDVLIAECSRYLGVRVSEEDIQDFLQMEMSELALVSKTPEEEQLWLIEIKRRLAIRKFLKRKVIDEVVISEDRVSHYYEENKDEFKEEASYHIRFLQVAEEERANEFRKVMRKSKKLFREVAAEYAANEGYAMAVPLKFESLSAPFQKAISRMKPGQHSRVIPIKSGEVTFYYVLYLESVTPEVQLPYEEAYMRIRRKLEQEQRQKLVDRSLEEFRTRTPIRFHATLLPFTYTEPSKRKEESL